MIRRRKTIGIGVAAVLLLAGLTTGAQGQVAGAGTMSGGFALGTGEAGMQIKGRVVCTGCSLAEVRKTRSDRWGNHIYRLTHRQEQVVMAVDWISDSRRWNHLITFPHLRLRGDERLFATLTAEENLFKEVQLAGILSPSQTLDMNTVTLLE